MSAMKTLRDRILNYARSVRDDLDWDDAAIARAILREFDVTVHVAKDLAFEAVIEA